MLSVRDLCFSREGTTVVEAFDLHVDAGEVVGLIGPNGAGKSTVLRLCAGTLSADRGSVLLDNVDVREIEPEALARQRSYLAQDAGLMWPLTVEALVALGRIPYGRRDEAGARAVASALERTEIVEFRERTLNTLSGGERMRALLARLLAVEASLVLADEPIAALDPHFQLQVMSLLRAEADAGRGVLVVLHDLSLAARFCDRLVLMNEGRGVAAGPPEQVLTSAHLASSYRIDALTDFDGDVPSIVPVARL